MNKKKLFTFVLYSFDFYLVEQFAFAEHSFGEQIAMFFSHFTSYFCLKNFKSM